MKATKDTGIPGFKSLEEEKEYWEARGPLAEGRRGRITKPKLGQKRSSFLAVRLTGEELTLLRNISAKQGLGPSTFARLVLTSIIEQKQVPKYITLDQLKEALVTNLPQSVKEKAEALAKNIAVGDPKNPALLLIDASQMKEFEEFTVSWLRALLAIGGVQMITPEDNRYEKMREIAKA